MQNRQKIQREPITNVSDCNSNKVTFKMERFGYLNSKSAIFLIIGSSIHEY